MSAVRMDRRGFLQSASGGLLLGFQLSRGAKAAIAALDSKLNAWVPIGSDDSVTLFIHKAEMGQGTVTSLSMLLAEELECDWKKIRTEFPGIDRAYGPNQGGGGRVGQVSAARQHHAEGCFAVSRHRQGARAPRYPVEGQRQREIRNRRAP